MKTKTCTRCNTEKPLTEFYSDGKKNDLRASQRIRERTEEGSYKSRCRACCTDESRIRRAKRAKKTKECVVAKAAGDEAKRDRTVAKAWVKRRANDVAERERKANETRLALARQRAEISAQRNHERDVSGVLARIGVEQNRSAVWTY